MTQEEFVTTIRAGHQGRLVRRKLRAIHHAARTSIGIEAGAQAVSSESSLLVEKLRLLVRLVDETEEGKYLLSIIGLTAISSLVVLPGGGWIW